MEIWAHRGASADAPENTMAAFALAEEQGADGVEFDVHRSADGHLVVIHDETIDRTTTGRGAVAELPLGELQRHAIPTLAEVLAWLPEHMVANIELKTLPSFYPGIAEEAVRAIARVGIADRVWVSSFNHHTLVAVRAADPALRLGVLAAAHLWRPATYLQHLGAAAYHPNAAALQSPEIVTQCHDAGLRVHAWTLDDPEHIRRAAALGVDAVITNRPAAARAAVR